MLESIKEINKIIGKIDADQAILKIIKFIIKTKLITHYRW
ncbi:MAG: hypothetical protein CM15mV124_090 [uncultured marine virus]|nr:MAG: hypothetical protein CM15mV124_090 [uncultured marine virus]